MQVSSDRTPADPDPGANLTRNHTGDTIAPDPGHRRLHGCGLAGDCSEGMLVARWGYCYDVTGAVLDTCQQRGIMDLLHKGGM